MLLIQGVHKGMVRKPDGGVSCIGVSDDIPREHPVQRQRGIFKRHHIQQGRIVLVRHPGVRVLVRQQQLHDATVYALDRGVEEHGGARTKSRGVWLADAVFSSWDPDAMKYERVIDPVLLQLMREPVESVHIRFRQARSQGRRSIRQDRHRLECRVVKLKELHRVDTESAKTPGDTDRSRAVGEAATEAYRCSDNAEAFSVRVDKVSILNHDSTTRTGLICRTNDQ